MGLTMHLMFSNNNKLSSDTKRFHFFFRSGDKIYVFFLFFYYLAVNEN